jgi:aspartate kinase
MAIVVQKFGGSSVANADKIRRCAARAVEARRTGNDVIVVVSAMGDTTDDLIDLARQITDSPAKREMDMLLATGEQVSIALMTMAIHSMGMDAVSMTGGQLGIITDETHTKARIRSIDEDRIRRELERGRIIVAAGFQGTTGSGDITTLGRGGSDTTAVALAAALSRHVERSADELGAESMGGARDIQQPSAINDQHRTSGLVPPPSKSGGVGLAPFPAAGAAARSEPSSDVAASVPAVVCEIYTDVLGVYTADPRKVPRARKLDRISYEEMLELASLGAAVMHNRAVIFGWKYDVPIHVRHSHQPDPGTMIVRESADMEDIAVVGCALKQDLGRVSLRRVPNRPGVQSLIFQRIAEANIMVDDIMQTEFGEQANISFTVDHADLADVKVAAGKALDEIGTGELAIEIGLAKVSAVGAGMRTHSGIASTMFEALGKAGVPINNITTSEIKISCILPQQMGEKALQAVHDAFGLGG